MLVKTDYKNQFKSYYRCDRCGIELNTKERNVIYLQTFRQATKKYCDLCNKCFKALERGIKNGKKTNNICNI